MKNVCFVFVLLLVGSRGFGPRRVWFVWRATRAGRLHGSFGSRRFRRAADPFRRDPRRGRDRRTTPNRCFASRSTPAGVVHVGMDGGVGIDCFPAMRSGGLPFYLSDLAYIRASGASDVDCAGLFESGGVAARAWADASGCWAGSSSARRGGRREALEAGGSSDIDASVRCRELNGTFSGASDAVLSGFSGNLYCGLLGSLGYESVGRGRHRFGQMQRCFEGFDAAGLVTPKLPCRGVGCCPNCAGTRREGAVGRQRRRVVDHLPGKSADLGSVVHSSASSRSRQAH